MSKARISPHMRHYGIALRTTKVDYTHAEVSEEALRRIAIIEEYVKHDDGAKGGRLCTTIHVPGRVCRRIEGHNG